MFLRHDLRTHSFSFDSNGRSLGLSVHSTCKSPFDVDRRFCLSQSFFCLLASPTSSASLYLDVRICSHLDCKSRNRFYIQFIVCVLFFASFWLHLTFLTSFFLFFSLVNVGYCAATVRFDQLGAAGRFDFFLCFDRKSTFHSIASSFGSISISFFAFTPFAFHRALVVFAHSNDLLPHSESPTLRANTLFVLCSHTHTHIQKKETCLASLTRLPAQFIRIFLPTLSCRHLFLVSLPGNAFDYASVVAICIFDSFELSTSSNPNRFVFRTNLTFSLFNHNFISAQIDHLQICRYTDSKVKSSQSSSVRFWFEI